MEPGAPHPSSWSGCRTVRLLGKTVQQPRVRRRAISLKVGLVVEVVAGCWGRAGLLSWPSPKPVTPRHLETITRNNGGSRGPGCSGAPAPDCSGKQRNWGPAAISRPHLHHHCLFWHRHTQLPRGPAVRKSQPLNYKHGGWWPGWVPRSQARSQETPPTPVLLSEQHSCITVALGGVEGRPQFPHRRFR